MKVERRTYSEASGPRQPRVRVQDRSDGGIDCLAEPTDDRLMMRDTVAQNADRSSRFNRALCPKIQKTAPAENA
jgi:hypothetical protein